MKKFLWAVCICCGSLLTSQAAVVTLELFGGDNVNTTFSAKAASSWWRNDSAVLAPGERIISAQFTFPQTQAWRAGDVYFGMVDQYSGGGTTGGFLHIDGANHYYEPSSDYFLTANDTRGRPFIYTQLAQINFPSPVSSTLKDITYSLSPAQLAVMNEYLLSPRVGWWAFALDTDVAFNVLGVATLTLTTAPVPEPSTYIAGCLALLPLLTQFIRRKKSR